MAYPDRGAEAGAGAAHNCLTSAHDGGGASSADRYFAFTETSADAGLTPPGPVAVT